MRRILLFSFSFLLGFAICISAQQNNDSPFSDGNFSGLKLRNIGPAFTSGRIADIAIHPEDDNIWYIATGSSGVWKTNNAGTTWTPIFDRQKSYSTGCITIDPNNPHTIWLGTGENVGGRHVGFGDGIYKSEDDGKTWKNIGLKDSEHISKIVVHPKNSDIIWVAVQGPLWNSGGERGLYKTTDGGNSWNKVLGDEEWTGVTDVIIDPRNPDWLYAATWQRHRTVAAYMGGGPKSGIHRSKDGGNNWEKLSNGLPNSGMGKIGLAISPQKPDIVYAAVELNRAKGGIYKSTNRGSSWSKQSNTVSGGTGPHYYQELYACPHNYDRIYLMDVRVQVSNDGGKTFNRLSEGSKHSDNHAIAFRADDPDYILLGSDGGLYESFDLAATWRFFDNMPITQYYKVAVDDQEPFYHVFGGTQDNGSHGGPSRTDNRHGLRNADWYKTLGADGHQSATEPGNPNITYAETQQGGMHRIDRITGEQLFIQPQSLEGEANERYNWDAPIIVSTHSPSRLYFASTRVWRSDSRGDSWTPVSEDLTRGQDRMQMPIMGQTWSWDAAWDMRAMSNYNTITSLAESPIQEGLLYAGTDDGLIHVTENGGASWTRIEVDELPGVPSTAFVNDLRADLHDANTVYAALDNHKYGDFSPYLFKSTDKGKNWKSISSNIPDRSLVWRTVQDHIKPELQFAATEFGIYFTINGGDNWVKLTGGVPTISFRDITIQRREDDLVAASFGRSFFILDDYSALREVSEEQMKEEATLFSTRKALWYNPKSIISSQGDALYAADNPDFGAVFTYYLSEGLSTLKAERQKEERKLLKDKKEINFPGWDQIEAERKQGSPKIWLTIKDASGNVVRKITGPANKGFHRISWDLRYSSKRNINLRSSGQGGGSRRFSRGGVIAMPGSYIAELAKEVNGMVTPLSRAIEFEVVPLREPALKGDSYAQIAQFLNDLQLLQSAVSAANSQLSESKLKVQAMKTALSRADAAPGRLDKELYDLALEIDALDVEINGNPSKEEIGESSPITFRDRLGVAFRGASTTYGPSEMHKSNFNIAKKEFTPYKNQIERISGQRIPALEKALEAIGAPWIEGQAIPGLEKN